MLKPSKQQSCSVQPRSSAGTVLNTTNQPCFQPFLPRTPHPLAPAPHPRGGLGTPWMLGCHGRTP